MTPSLTARAQLVQSFSVTGGATYCAVAALHLMGCIKANQATKSTGSSAVNVPSLLEWALQVWSCGGVFPFTLLFHISSSGSRCLLPC